MGKGEIARYEQFLLFPQCFQKACFQKACFPGVSKGVTVWEWVNAIPHNPQGSSEQLNFEFRCTSLIFCGSTGLRRSKFHQSTVFQTFFYTLADIVLLVGM